jgi:transcriptional regulator of acetoin/glycerol metabolism
MASSVTQELAMFSPVKRFRSGLMASVVNAAPYNQANSTSAGDGYLFEPAESATQTAPSLQEPAGPLPDLAMERAREDLAEREYLNLIRWAVRKAPDLLRILRIAYLFAQDSPATSEVLAKIGDKREASGCSRFFRRQPRADVQLLSEKLEDVEREHIRRILTESATVLEAALKLGIDNSTLWRKHCNL